MRPIGDAALEHECRETQHRDFLLAALHGAAVHARLLEADALTIRVALQGKLIDCETAVRWIEDAGLMGLVGNVLEDKKRSLGSAPNHDSEQG